MKKTLIAMVMAGLVQSVHGAEGNTFEQCLLQQIQMPENVNLTAGEIAAYCRDQQALTTRLIAEDPGVTELPGEPGMPAGFRDFFTPYKQNYILFGSMQNKNGGEPFSGKTMDIRFEFGMKFRMFQNTAEYARLSPLHFGYSQKSWWDIAESSAPFKEHNYNPEIFWDFEDPLAGEGYLPSELGRFVDRFGYEHQSNGRDGLASRSWDRLYAQKTFRFPEQNLSLRLKAWNVVNRGEENTDITDFIGNGEAKLTYHAPSTRWELSTSVMKGHHTSKYSYRVDYVSDLSAWLNSRFMLSYYDGYGEALISYNEKTQSLRAGVFVPLIIE